MSPILGIMASSTSGNLTAFDSIATTTVGAGGAASITFSSIASTYKHLQIRGIARDTGAGSGQVGVKIQFNGDTNFANYTYHRLIGTGAAASSYGQAGGDYPFVIPLDGNTASSYSAGNIDILDYSSTNKYKTTRILDGCDNNDTTGIVGLKSQAWLNTAAITSIVLTPSTGSFKQYSSFALYGIK